ncbi:MAG: DUF1700 domain-containing protein [Clostridia bacterium]|nr:DUF1700 domain-containing protein [Clostridia bacterium]
MTEKKFLKELKKRLKGLDRVEVERSLAFYRELIADKREEGMTEEQAVASCGLPEAVAADILSAASEERRERAYWSAPKRDKKESRLKLVLLIVGFPVWFPLSVAAISVVFSLAVAVASVLLALCVAWAAVLAGSVIGFVASLFSFATGDAALGLMEMGTSMMLFAGTMALFMPIKTFFLWLFKEGKRLWRGVRRRV